MGPREERAVEDALAELERRQKLSEGWSVIASGSRGSDERERVVGSFAS